MKLYIIKTNTRSTHSTFSLTDTRGADHEVGTFPGTAVCYVSDGCPTLFTSREDALRVQTEHGIQGTVKPASQQVETVGRSIRL